LSFGFRWNGLPFLVGPEELPRKLPLDFHTPEAYMLPMYTFIESTIFERELPNYLGDSEYAELQCYLIEHPEAGAVIPGSGGVRKLRWNRPGSGKRGGVRIIYYVRYRPNEFWMLTIYAKARHDSIPAHIVRALKERFSHEP
jgi:hypothetical protein